MRKSYISVICDIVVSARSSCLKHGRQYAFDSNVDSNCIEFRHTITHENKQKNRGHAYNYSVANKSSEQRVGGSNPSQCTTNFLGLSPLLIYWLYHYLLIIQGAGLALFFVFLQQF